MNRTINSAPASDVLGAGGSGDQTNEEADTEQETFRFFDLPRELRNTIYSYCGRDVGVAKYAVTPIDDCEQFWQASSFPVAGARLLNRQFKQEYEEEVLRFTNIILQLPAWYSTDVYTAMPLALASFRSGIQQFTLELSITSPSFPGVSETIYHVREDADLLTLSAVIMQVMRRETRKLCKLLPTLRNLRLDILGTMKTFERDGKPDVAAFFKSNLTGGTAQRSTGSGFVKIEQYILLHNPLYSINPEAFDDEGLADWTNESSRNQITYRAKHCPHGSAWHNPTLQTESAGTYDYNVGV